MGTQFLKFIFFLFVVFQLVLPVSAFVLEENFHNSPGVLVVSPVDWLPELVQYGSTGKGNDDAVGGIIKIIKLIIQYTAVIAVIAVIYWGIQYVLSFWADDKIKKAKWIIIYALVWVGLSIAAYTMVAIVASVSTYNFY